MLLLLSRLFLTLNYKNNDKFLAPPEIPHASPAVLGWLRPPWSPLTVAKGNVLCCG